jgi:hypothetical protein
MRSLLRTALAASAGLALGVLACAGRVCAQAAADEEAQAVVVLIAEASESVELREVIAELLSRQNVAPRFEPSARFDPDAWLDQSASDASTWAFVRLRDAHRAQLYFRGPHGERFLLRELELRDGLDEVGRELIARVVETAVVALLRSSEGMSREQARAGLEADEAPQPEPAAPAPPPPPAQPVPATPPEPRHIFAQLGLRALGQWTGSDLGARAAFGLEGAVELRRPRWPRLRVRLAAELALPQSVAQDAVEARVITAPLRLGVDVGTSFGLYLGLATGFDVSHLAPRSAGDSGLMLAHSSTELIPASRAELRQELALGGAFWLAFAAMIDVPWKATRYDVIEAGASKTLAKPAAVQPGLALTLGVTP